jgi:methylated-DNA-[protein]-cysteine S-methyltransferase
MFYTYINSPIGSILLTSNGTALTGLFTCNHPLHNAYINTTPKHTPLFDTVAEQLEKYFKGDLTVFTIPLYFDGTPFQVHVWKTLQTIPYGQTWSYKDIATAVGNSNASRAVGSANNKNPISIIIPCHRVISSQSKLVGYAGGISTQQHLLHHEKNIQKLRHKK